VVPSRSGTCQRRWSLLLFTRFKERFLTDILRAAERRAKRHGYEVIGSRTMRRL